MLHEINHAAVVSIVANGAIDVMAIGITLDDDLVVAGRMTHYGRAAPRFLGIKRIALTRRVGAQIDPGFEIL
jgi:hypothetical protein